MKLACFDPKYRTTRPWILLVAISVCGSHGCAVISGLDEFEVANEVNSGSGGVGGMTGTSSSGDTVSSSSASSSSGATSSSSGASTSGSSSSSSASSSASSSSSSSGGSVGGLVLGEVYQSGGKQGADYTNDYVVLVNTSNATVNVGGWALQHYKTGNGWVALPLPNASIPVGGSFLVGLYNDGGGGQGKALPNPGATSPASSDWNLSTSNGEALAITNDSTVLSTCNSSAIVDLVGLNSSPPCKEGAFGAPTPTTTTSAHRKAGETQDTNDNAADFELGPTSP